MTIDEVIEILKRTPRTWKLTSPSGLIRNELKQCPLGAVCDIHLDMDKVEPAVGGPTGWLGMTWGDGCEVMMAADDRGCPATRARLLKACGI